MLSSDIKKRYDELIKLVLEYDNHYYNLDDPLVEDSVYDTLMLELISIERKHPSLKREDSPSQRVGGFMSDAFSKVAHHPPMLSLDNIFTEEDLRNFDNRCKKKVDNYIAYSIELKFDGLAVEAIYENGRFIKGSTRGDGAVGEDVTANLSAIKSLPLALKADNIPEMLSVRGEVFMTHSEFERLNRIKGENGESPFANPRNAAAGSLRQLNPEITEFRELNIVFYDVGRIVIDNPIRDNMSMFDYLRNLGLPAAGYLDYGGVDKAVDFYKYWIDNRHKLDFDIDGIVIKISDFDIRDKLGATSKAPRWAAAWKFPAKEAVTVLESVNFQVGRTGVITPVANLRPINIGGVLVKRATLHNFDEIKRLGIKIGDSVRLKRAGDVIPKIIEIIADKRPSAAQDIQLPVSCPSCDSALKREEIYVRCVNIDCGARKLEILKFFVSRSAMDIEFVGPELIARLNFAGKLSSIADIYSITKDDLLQLERMGEKLADKVIASIDKRRSITLSHFLRSLGIRNVGSHIAKTLANTVRKLDSLRKMEIEDIALINEIGPEAAEAVYDFFHNKGSVRIVDDMIKAGVVVADEIEEGVKLDTIAGKSFIFTGSLKKYSRKQAQELVEKYGGKFSGSVSKKTDYLVAGESPGSKYDKADKLGVNIISEEEFLMMIGEPE